jgi:hypothetical protein
MRDVSIDTSHIDINEMINFNPLNVQLNLICHLLALLRAHHILHVGRIRVKKILPTTQLCFLTVPETTCFGASIQHMVTQ